MERHHRLRGWRIGGLHLSGKVLTFQAVKNNTNVTPSSSTCTATVQPPNCNWDQVYQSAASGVVSTQTDTMTGTYTTQSNGSGVMQIKPTGATTSSSFSILVQPAPLALGYSCGVIFVVDQGHALQSDHRFG